MFLLRYSLKKQQPVCLPNEGGLAGMKRLGPHLAFSCKHRGNTPRKTCSPHGARESDVGSSCKKAEIINQILDPHEK